MKHVYDFFKKAEVLYMKNVVATISSFGGTPVVIEF